MSETNEPIFAFFGTSEISVIALEELKEAGYLPKVVVTSEDKPKGRKMILTPPVTKIWAEKEDIPTLQLKTLRDQLSLKSIMSFSPEGYDLFVVVSYGKIIPDEILSIPKYKTINIHPSLLPKLRGPSPIISAILNENKTGVTIIRLDNEVDHGPIVAQRKIEVQNWPPYEKDLEKVLGKLGGEMLVEVIPKWLKGEIKETPQDHSMATFCKKIKKEDGQLDLKENPEKNLRKIHAFHDWPGAYFFLGEGNCKKRIIVKTAHIENDELILDRVVPEGKKEMNYSDFLRGIKQE